jgi:hypothetical protein
MLFSALTGLTAPALLLQRWWAGILVECNDQRDDPSRWIEVHARGGEVAPLLAVAASAVALCRHRLGKGLCIGSPALLVLLLPRGPVPR